MGKVKKALLAVLIVGVVAGIGRAASTKFTNVEVTGALVVDGAETVSGVTTQSSTTFSGAFIPWPLTLAQINALTSGTTGQVVLCKDCTMTKVCVSSGTTAVAQWTVTQGTAPTLAPVHCQ